MIPCIFQCYKWVQQSFQIFPSFFLSFFFSKLYFFIKKISFWRVMKYAVQQRKTQIHQVLMVFTAVLGTMAKNTNKWCYCQCSVHFIIFELLSLFQFIHACELYNINNSLLKYKCIILIPLVFVNMGTQGLTVSDSCFSFLFPGCYYYIQ